MVATPVTRRSHRPRRAVFPHRVPQLYSLPGVGNFPCPQLRKTECPLTLPACHSLVRKPGACRRYAGRIDGCRTNAPAHRLASLQGSSHLRRVPPYSAFTRFHAQRRFGAFSFSPTIGRLAVPSTSACSAKHLYGRDPNLLKLVVAWKKQETKVRKFTEPKK